MFTPKVYSSNLRSMLLIFSFVPIGIIAITAISVTMKENLYRGHFMYMSIGAVFLYLSLVSLALLFGYRKVTINESTLKVETAFRSRLISGEHVHSIKEVKRTKAYATQGASFLEIHLKNGTALIFPLHPFLNQTNDIQRELETLRKRTQKAANNEGARNKL